MAWSHLLWQLAIARVHTTHSTALAGASPDCDQVLAADCDAARRVSLFACGSCVGAHQHDLQAAGCNATHTGQFCSNQTCVLNPESFLGGVCNQARKTGPFSCAKCLGEHMEELSSSKCSEAQQQAFCNFGSCTPVAPDSPPPVSTRSALLYGCHHINVKSLTINGKDGVDATVPVNKPVTFGLTIADTVSSGSCTCLSCITQLYGAMYKYEPDNQLHSPTGPGNCWGDHNDESVSWSGHYTMAFTPDATGVYYFRAVQGMSMSCNQAAFKGRKTNFSNWAQPKCDGFGSCGGLARIVVA